MKERKGGVEGVREVWRDEEGGVEGGWELERC